MHYSTVNGIVSLIIFFGLVFWFASIIEHPDKKPDKQIDEAKESQAKEITTKDENTLVANRLKDKKRYDPRGDAPEGIIGGDGF